MGIFLLMFGAWAIYADINTFRQVGHSPIAGLVTAIGLFVIFIGVCFIQMLPDI